MARRANSEYFLIQEAFAPSTRDAYERAVSAFIAWCEQHGDDCHSAPGLDRLLTDYIHDLYEEGGMAVANAPVLSHTRVQQTVSSSSLRIGIDSEGPRMTSLKNFRLIFSGFSRHHVECGEARENVCG